MTSSVTLARPLAAEAIGTALLLASIVGSGIVVGAAEVSLPMQLMAHAVVVGLTLTTLITVLGPISGAHFNPAVTLGLWLQRQIPSRTALAYICFQLAGGIVGTAATNAMFGLPALMIASTTRAGATMLASELVATTGLLLVIYLLVRGGKTDAVAGAVGAYIAAAIVFTPSDSFANPAVTLARILTDTWTGIAPGSVPQFIAGQLAAALIAAALARWLIPAADAAAQRCPEELAQ